jgi:hypothetical protein
MVLRASKRFYEFPKGSTSFQKVLEGSKSL